MYARHKTALVLRAYISFFRVDLNILLFLYNSTDLTPFTARLHDIRGIFISFVILRNESSQNIFLFYASCTLPKFKRSFEQKQNCKRDNIKHYQFSLISLINARKSRKKIPVIYVEQRFIIDGRIL